MDHWTLLRRYRGLVRVGEARAFLCPECNTPLQTIRDQYNEPVLWCPGDNSGFVPGTDFWGDVKAVVSEYYLE